MWMGTLMLAFLSALLPIKEDSKKETDIVRLALIGIFIFELLFEARARYIFVCVPFFVIAAENTIQFLFTMLDNRKVVE
jgi:hypothetical protein